MATLGIMRTGPWKVLVYSYCRGTTKAIELGGIRKFPNAEFGNLNRSDGWRYYGRRGNTNNAVLADRNQFLGSSMVRLKEKENPPAASLKAKPSIPQDREGEAREKTHWG